MAQLPVQMLVFGVVMIAINYFGFCRNKEGRLRLSIVGGVIAGLIYGGMMYLIGQS